MFCKTNTIGFSILVSVCIVIGCSPSYKTTEAEAKREPTIVDYEKSFDPVPYSKELLSSEKKSETSGRLYDEIYQSSHDSVVLQEEIVQGFRIQMYSSSNYDEANKMKLYLQEHITPDSVYIIFDAPVYKVRIGDFRNRYEANQRLLQLISEGHRDAWVVPDKVIIRKKNPLLPSE